MKIGIDARLLERPMTGIGRYLSNLLRCMPDLAPENEYILFSHGTITGFARPNVRSVATGGVPKEGMARKLQSFIWLNFVLPKYIKKEKIDIFFSPNTLLPFRATGAINVIAVHDVFHLIDPRFHSPIYRAYISFSLGRTLARADMTLTVSEASKRDIVRLLGMPEAKVRVTSQGIDPRFRPMDIDAATRGRYAKKYGLPAKFALYVGVVEARKNIGTIMAVADMLANKEDIGFVIAGRPGYGGEEYIKEAKKRKNVHYIGFFDDADLPFLYGMADAFIFPSLYEGFGLPPVEAMRSGIPVVASNSSSLPEVLGDGAMLFAPEDVEGFAAAISTLLHDGAARKTLVEKGIAQAQKFTLEKSARETLAAFRVLQ